MKRALANPTKLAKPTNVAAPAKPLRVKSGKQAQAVSLEVVPELLSWFAQHARDLPWRVSDPLTGQRNPYRVLVSEVMLQQTQVSRVIDKFEAFLLRFPDISALAHAPLDDVLAAWTGLGYYRRARMLHACARAIGERWGGRVPDTVESLRDLPGIGAYTAGAIASLAFARSEPLVDTNVARVLLRVGGRELATSDKEAIAWTWQQAGQLVRRAVDRTTVLRSRVPNRAGAFNEALMELGATICVLSAPRCTMCPIRAHCQAFANGSTDRIPRKPPKGARGSVQHISLLLRDNEGSVLVEQRPATGLWAGLWQLPTLDRTQAQHVEHFDATVVARALGIRLPARVKWRAHTPFVFKTTHRDVQFVVYEMLAPAKQSQTDQNARRWCNAELFKRLGWSSTMKRLVGEALTAEGARAIPQPGQAAVRARLATRSAQR